LLTATCHCGAVRIELPRRPRTLTCCNCSMCRRYGALWAYYRPSSVRVTCAPGVTARYAWGEKTIRFVRCRRCGCVTHYERTRDGGRRIGVNARNVDPEALGPVRIRRLDGAATWKYLD
jgi:hypothetical protein